jgi:hypothetical protein
MADAEEDLMRALTLTQPWATLVALGAKRIETRSWHTKYTGPIAIHAAKGFPRWAKETCWTDPFASLLRPVLENAISTWNDPLLLPTGAVLATANLDGCRFTSDVVGQISEQERALGDYSAGRYAWFLSDVKVFYPPILATGAQGLWRWENPHG